MMVNQTVEQMWENYSEKAGEQNNSYTSWHFCNDEESANNLASLVKDGLKTATCSLHLFYGLENDELPKVGDLSIIMNWDGEPQAIIKTIKVNILPFKAVDEAFARKEGEGDRSLAYWRKVHIDFFTQELSEINQTFHEDLLTVCEEFEVVHC